VDVGACQGTRELYKAFPDAYHVLVEPLEEHEPHLRAILRNYRGQYFVTALGRSEGTVTINVEPKRFWRSSVHKRTALTMTGDVGQPRTIPVTTLDALQAEHGFEPPFGLKVDTEGADLDVVEGAHEFLRETEFVIAEVSIAERFEGGYSFFDFVQAMARRQFELCDVLELVPRKGAPGTTLMDGLFRRVSTAR
jgi:FkbM family methyltransferase